MRNIFTVTAKQLLNGNFTTVSGFPKSFDSDSYNGDVTKALRRAKAAFHAQLGLNYAVDDRDMQVVTLTQADGRVILRESEGGFPPDPEPEPAPEPEEEPSEPVGE